MACAILDDGSYNAEAIIYLERQCHEPGPGRTDISDKGL